jgi:hypothetical protein
LLDCSLQLLTDSVELFRDWVTEAEGGGEVEAFSHSCESKMSVQALGGGDGGRTDRFGDLSSRIKNHRGFESRIGGVERRPVCRLVRRDRNSMRFEVFEGKADVENRFAAGTDDRDGSIAERLQVGGDVEGYGWRR